jgi:hypothetical protein
MLEQLDRQIAEMEARLAALRQQKLAALQAQMAALQAAMSGSPAALVPAAVKSKGGRPRKDGLPPGSVKAPVFAPLPVAAPRVSNGPKKRGRRPGKRIPDDVLLERLKAFVAAAGKEGVSAREAAARCDIFYPKAIGLMKNAFKAHGTGKWTRYTVK